jgi:RHS repeat-associated protein
VTLQVPRNAVREWIKIRLSDARVTNNNNILEAFELSGRNFRNSTLSKFSDAVTLSISTQKYGNTEVVISWLNTKGQWQALPTTIDSKRKMATIKTTALGTFALSKVESRSNNDPTYGAQHLPTINGFGNDEFSGNSSVHYPFSLPPTPGGIPFNLGLSYSSESANSIFARRARREGQSLEQEFKEELEEYKRQASIIGWGWNLSGLGTITRESTGAKRVFLSYPYGRFELIDSGYRVWQTEPQAFVKIESDSDDAKTASQWWVWTPDGTRYTFGNSNWGQGVAYNLSKDNNCSKLMREAHLTEIRDVHGNRIQINYNAETKDWNSPCSNPEYRPYVRAIYPTEIKYFAADEELDTAHISFHYESGRSDTHVPYYDSEYVQSLFTEKRLDSITVEVRQNNSSYALSRRYTLEESYDSNNENDLHLMRLDKIVDHGRFANDNHDPKLPPWTFDYTYLEYDRNNVGYQNTTVLLRANNGQGGGVEYHYDKQNFLIVPCWENGHGETFRHYVKQKIISDGVGNQTIIDYQLEGSAWAHGDGWDAGCTDHFEFAGYEQVQRSVTRNGAVEQKVQTGYHQLVTGDNQNAPSHLSGLSDLQITLDANDAELQRVDPTWTVVADTHGTDWVRKDKETVTIDGVSKTSTYEYNTSLQNKAQYGNVTHVREFMNHDGSGTPYRTVETRYYPNNSGNNSDNIRYITNRPARQRLWAGNTNGTCQGDTVYSYDNQNYQSAPQKGLLTLSQVAQTSCNGTWSNTSYGYDTWGNQTSVTDPNGQTTSTSYDTSGNWPRLYAYPVSVTTPPPSGGGTGFTTEYTWDKYVGQVTSVTDPNDVVTTYQYDEWGRLWKEYLPGNGDSPTTAYSYYNYNPNTGRPFYVGISKRSNIGNGDEVSHIGQSILYDGLGREIQTRSTYVNPQNENKHAVTLTQYNGLGQPSTSYAPIEVDPSTYDGDSYYLGPNWSGWQNQPHTSTSYDALGRELDVTHPDGSRTAKRYGNEEVGGQIFFKHSIIDANRHRKYSRIDALGRTHSVVEQTGNCGHFEPGFQCGRAHFYFEWRDYAITTYNYDLADRLTGVTDHDGNSTTITYDLAGRKISMDDPDMGLWRYAYDAAGNLIRQTDARGQAICFYYDNLHRLTNKFYPNGNDGCPREPLFPLGVVYTYDAFDPDNGQFGRGQRTGMTDESGSTNWKYDQRGRMTEERRNFNSSSLGSFTTQWSYDALDRVRTMTYPADDEGNLGEVVTYHYEDAFNAQLSTVDSNLDGGTAYATNMKYNVYGQLTSLQHRRSVPIVREYEYYDLETQNGLGRLKKIMTTALGSVPRQRLEYSYDAVGNVTGISDMLRRHSQTFKYDELNRLVQASSRTVPGHYSREYRYDQIGNMIQKGDYSLSYDEHTRICPHPSNRAHAATIFGSDHGLCYDQNGNLQRKINPQGRTDYSYDAENRLRQVQEDGQILAQYTYDGDGNRVKVVAGDVTTIYIGNHVEWDIQTGRMTKYYYANGQRIAMREGGEIYYLLNDHLGSTSTILDYNGNGQSQLRYMPYGENRQSYGNIPTQRRFTGQIQDSTGLYFYNARYYDPMLGRFIQPDSIVPEPGNPQSLNRYSYVLNNPLRYTDPTGYCAGDPNDPDNPDAGCWAMIGKIEGTYNNITIEPDLWTEDELWQVWYGLLNHVFIIDIIGAPSITFIRESSHSTGASGYTYQRIAGFHRITIYDNAYFALPDGSGATEQPSLRNFQGTVIHELAHVAIEENPFILESYEMRSNWAYYPDSFRDWFNPTFGQSYNCRGCDMRKEKIAMAASTWQLMPESFNVSIGPISYTDWHYEWISSFYKPNPLAKPDLGPTSIRAR